MSKQSAVAVANESEEILSALPRNLHMGMRAGRKMTISRPKLRVEDGWEVVWDLNTATNIKIDLDMGSGGILSLTQSTGSTEIHATINLPSGETEPFQVPYTVSDGTGVLQHVNTLGTLADGPYLVIDHMGDPPVRPPHHRKSSPE